jgi:predicted dehydrogenase
MAIEKDSRKLRIGVVGCGPIAQIAHFDACRKARNVELYAICDVADDLRERMRLVWEPRVAYRQFEQMLADPQVEAVIIAAADQFHMALATQAIEAGKHVFIEKPMGVGVEECERLRQQVRDSRLVAQIGNNRRFDPGVAFAKQFVDEELGPRISLKAWYYDSAYRYTMTDNLQPVVWQSTQAHRPDGDPKADRRRYYLLGHASHLADSARMFGGTISSIRARLIERHGVYCWFVSVAFADGGLGHLDLTIAIQGDFEEGFMIYGERGSVKGHVFLPWYHKSSVVECFAANDRTYRRPLGEDAHTYKLQLEAFADTILHGAPQRGATIEDGAAAVRALVAIARSTESGDEVRLDQVTGMV